MTEYKLPELGEGVYEAELVEWRVAAGDSVEHGHTLAEVLTDKATMELPAPFTGVVSRLRAEPGDQVKIGDVILEYSSDATVAVPVTEAATAEKETEDDTKVATVAPAPASAKAAPSVRRKARQLGIDLSQVQGTGPKGRVLLADLEPADTSDGNGRVHRQDQRTGDFGVPGSRIKLIGLRRRIAERMALSKRTIPHYGYVDECNVTEMVRLRQSLKPTLAKQGVKLTYLAFFAKAAAAALREVPIVNASLDEDAGEIVLHEQANIGIAVATPAGLIVPVLRDADQKDIPTIAREVECLSQEARAGKSRLEDLRGGTFTITSIGGVGGIIASPVINPPEVGIMGIGKVVRRPVYDESDHLQPADLVYLSFSFDHRVLDGAVGAAFGNAVISRLENPATLLVE